MMLFLVAKGCKFDSCQYLCYVLMHSCRLPLQTTLNAFKDAAGDDMWLQLLSAPLPKLDQHPFLTNPHLVRSFEVITELRTEAMVKCVL